MMRDRKPVRNSVTGCCQRNFALLCFTLLVKLMSLSICCVLIAMYTALTVFCMQPIMRLLFYVVHVQIADGKIGGWNVTAKHLKAIQ